ncbi:MAG: UDP-2,3-diacylglucosamine diphosphatase [Zoogloeaceae bacterium]|nr:UDP-2,3-diacylglucosamine diphosphatase [Zoogloeaceae bacterium]
MLHFISDLHLSPQTPGIEALFRAFLAAIAPPENGEPNALYILGDLFDTWIGDDDDSPFAASIASALKTASDAGLRLFFLHGNRDFLLGADFARQAGLTLLPDPYLLSTPQWQFILSHGDSLCANDLAYQQFRAQTRAPAWQADFLQKPLPERRRLAAALRQQSLMEKNRKPAYLTDLAPGATDDFLRQHGYATFIHGHTHRPARHEHIVDGICVERWVLSDWSEERGETLSWNGETLRRQSLT